jgi:hypothetical protein
MRAGFFKRARLLFAQNLRTLRMRISFETRSKGAIARENRAFGCGLLDEPAD